MGEISKRGLVVRNFNCLMELLGDMFIRFCTIWHCDGQTDGHADG